MRGSVKQKAAAPEGAGIGGLPILHAGNMGDDDAIPYPGCVYYS